MTYPVGSIVKVFDGIYVKDSDESWSIYSSSTMQRDDYILKFFAEFNDDEIEVIRKPTPKDTLRALPVGSVVAGGLYGAVARKTDEDEWAVSLREWSHDSEDAAECLSESGEIRVLLRGDEV